MSVNAIDILLVVVVLLSLGNGYRRGFTNGIIDLAGWSLSLVAGLRFYQPVAKWLAPRVDLWSELWDQPIAFILVAIAAGTLVHLLGYGMLRRLPKNFHERPLNKILGLVTGLANGLILAAILSALLLAIPLHETLSEQTRESRLVNRL